MCGRMRDAEMSSSVCAGLLVVQFTVQKPVSEWASVPGTCGTRPALERLESCRDARRRELSMQKVYSKFDETIALLHRTVTAPRGTYKL